MVDRTWNLGILIGTPTYVAITPDAHISIRFDRAGGAEAGGTCSGLAATFTVKGKEIDIVDGDIQGVGCGDVVDSRDNAVWAALNAITTWQVNSVGWLYLEGPEGRPQMVWHPVKSVR